MRERYSPVASVREPRIDSDASDERYTPAHATIRAGQRERRHLSFGESDEPRKVPAVPVNP
jgi:hypothetical protein